MKLLISGYGGEGRPSIGKYEVKDGTVREIWSDAPAAPSFLCQTDGLLFAGLERQGSGEVLSYRKEGEEYKLLHRVPVEGGELCHLSFDGQNLYGACYGTGHLFVCHIEGNSFGKCSHLCQEGGETRAHYCAAGPGGKFVYGVNIAQDRVYCYLPGKGELTENPAFPYLQLPKGEGPRHLCFHPQLPMAYLITEYTSRVFQLTLDRETGALAVRGQVSAPPEEFEDSSYGSGIVISRDGSRLYAGNRGANTISVFAVNADGSPEKVQDASCGDDWPRCLSLTREGGYLVVANQRSNDVALLPVRPNGTLGEADMRIPFASPSFAEEEK